MGTSVAHKVLQALWTEPKYDNKLPSGSLSQVLKFRLLMQVSNCSFVLSADRQGHYGTLVKPSAIGNRGVCRTMVNVSHAFDVVSEVVPFKPPQDQWLDAHTQWGKGYVDLGISRISSSNVHSICHYFDNPLVHVSFLETVLDRRIPDRLKTKRLQEFEARTPLAQFKKLQGQLSALKERSIADAPDFIVSTRSFVDLIRSFT